MPAHSSLPALFRKASLLRIVLKRFYVVYKKRKEKKKVYSIYCFNFISDGHSTDSIDFFWSENPVSLTEGIKFPEFELVKTTPYSCSKVYYGSKYC